MQYTETQLTKLIEDVEKEFTAHLAKAEGTLAPLSKAEEGDKKPFEKKPEDKESKPESAPEANPEHEGKPEGKPEMEAKPEGNPEEKPQVNPQNPEAAPAHDYDQEDIEHLHKMYMSMSEGERKVHHDAIMKCAGGMAKCGDVEGSAPHGDPGQQSADSHSHPNVQKSELNTHGGSENPPQPKVKGANLDNDPKNGGIEGQEPNDALGPKSPASNANGAKINKSEHARRNGGKQEQQEPHNSPGAKSPASKADGMQMKKSELGTETELLKSELGSVTSKYDELKKNFDAVTEFLTKLVEMRPAPAAKAITSLETIAKSEGEGEASLSKQEIDGKLLAKSQDPKTSKADRDAINDFYLSNQDIKGISHLLK